MFSFLFSGNDCCCSECMMGDEDYRLTEEEVRQQRNAASKARRERIKAKEDYRDKPSEYGILFNFLVNDFLKDAPKCLVQEIVDLTYEDDRCHGCGVRKGRKFMVPHKKNPRSCFACKNDHTTMTTRAKAKKKFGFKELEDSDFLGLQSTIIRQGLYGRRTEYFLVDDLQELCRKKGIEYIKKKKTKKVKKKIQKNKKNKKGVKRKSSGLKKKEIEKNVNEEINEEEKSKRKKKRINRQKITKKKIIDLNDEMTEETNEESKKTRKIRKKKRKIESNGDEKDKNEKSIRKPARRKRKKRKIIEE